MIDLTKELQHAIEFNGTKYEIRTDYRAWLLFDQKIKQQQTDFRFLFPSDIPCFYVGKKIVMPHDVYEQLVEFYLNSNPLPKKNGDDDGVDFDWNIDSEYIISAFLQVYGIDLISTAMHWHRFLALFRGLPAEGTMFSAIMEARGYTGDDKDKSKARRSWSLPTTSTTDENDEFSKAFTKNTDIEINKKREGEK